MSKSPITWLPEDFSGPFPDPAMALSEPNGLLAAGGNLKPDTLLQAYTQGIFPWYSDDQPILWWSPNPRWILYPHKFHATRRFQRTLRQKPFDIKIDTAFENVMRACAAPRADQSGTWITDEMLNAYVNLHQQGYAHSIECWQDEQLVGGVYGIKLNNVFFGESMFSRSKEASKVALHYICTQMKPKCIDAQIHSSHLESLGAEALSRQDFIQLINS